MSPPHRAAARTQSRRSSTAVRGVKRQAARSSSGARRSPSGAAKSSSRVARSSGRAGRHRRQGARLRISSVPRASRLPFLIASFVLVGLLVVGVASLQAVVSQGSFRMQDLTQHNLELQEEYGRLKLEVAELSSPGRIAARARRMGLHLPQPGDVSTLRVKGTMQSNGGAGTLNAPAVSLRSLLERRP